MDFLSINLNNNVQRPAFGQRKNVNSTTSPLAPLQKDTVSFSTHLKKSQLEGIDFAVVEKFKAPIEKFKTNDDLQNWAKEQSDIIVNKDFGGRQEETKIQRKAMLKEWVDYITKENDAYNNTTALLILNAVTKDLKPNNDKLPPVLNKGVLADCISEIDKNIKADKKYLFDLNKMYETKMRALYLEDTKTEDGNTGWVVIPSKSNDPENFEKNVEKLKTLSHKNWCTKSFNAEPYLSQGDFHVYLENGQPKLGVRFVDDEIQEIQGELNNGKIPLSYFGEAKKHIEENNLKLTGNAESEVEDAEILNKKAQKIKNDLKSAIETNDVKTILEYFGVNVKQDDDGMLTISNYEEPNSEISFADLGINENNLFKKIKCIDCYGDFSNSKVTNLGNLQSIGGFAYFNNSQVTNLGNLQSIGGDAYFNNSQVTNLGNLQSIGGKIYYDRSPLTEESFKNIIINKDTINNQGLLQRLKLLLAKTFMG